MSLDEDQLKMAAAESAVTQVKDGMVVGLGSGSTAAFAVSALARRVRKGLRIVGIPTSERTAAQARELGIPLSDLSEQSRIDMTIDGADEAEEGSLDLIKGHGGALLREKIVAFSTEQLVIVIHRTKLVKKLGVSFPVPVEVVPFAWQTTARRLSDLGIRPSLRHDSDGAPFRSDGGNYIIDCTFAPVVAVESLAGQLDHVVGVVEHGFFVGLTAQVHVASDGGVEVLRPQPPQPFAEKSPACASGKAG
jgi:ribose 5-phosphate isomerase A